jgi:hypothetical protein
MPTSEGIVPANLISNRNLIIAMAVRQGITTLCAVFVAARVAQVTIFNGFVQSGVIVYNQPIDVRVVR